MPKRAACTPLTRPPRCDFADVVIIAVKPYQVEGVVAPIRENLQRKIVVSVAAGLTFDDYEQMLPRGRPM